MVNAIPAKTGEEENVVERQLPPTIEKRLKSWRHIRDLCWFLYWFLGSITILFAGIAAVSLVKDPWRSIAALIASVSTGIVGYVHPREQHDRMHEAWLILDTAARRYKYNKTSSVDDLNDLNKAVDDAEAMLKTRPWPSEGAESR
jgi:hypothetical protein